MSAILTQRETARALEKLGFNVGRSQTRARLAARNFKLATTYEDLRSDRGLYTSAVGPKMSRALREAVDRLDDSAGTMSRHFDFSEARCKCGGRYAGCIGVWASRGSVRGLEKVRAEFYPGGLRPVSWCRCVGHNRAEGGARSSRHLKGDAIDVPHTVTVRKMIGLAEFGGLGVAASDGQVSHVDVRPGSRRAPVMWRYPHQ